MTMQNFTNLMPAALVRPVGFAIDMSCSRRACPLGKDGMVNGLANRLALPSLATHRSQGLIVIESLANEHLTFIILHSFYI
jgi:hypothetical protein